MKEKHCTINKYASMLYRLSHPYFEKKLALYHIGSGQQFFLMRVYEHPGISMQALAQLGCYDKGTTNRAVEKLREQGYVRVECDKSDRRVRRIFATEKALTVMQVVYDMLGEWNDVLMHGISEEDRKLCERVMERMTQNAYNYRERE